MGKIAKEKFTLVSLVVPNWNGKHFLDDCLGTLLNQNYPNFEVIMADNGSTDGSVEYVKKKFPSVRIVENEKNLGFSGGVNSGIRVAKGEYVVILNNDMIFYRKDFISELVKAAESDKSIGIVGGMWLDAREPKKIQNVEGTKLKGVLDYIYWFGGKNEHEEDHGQYKELIDVEAVNGLIKREVFDRIGLYDEGFFFSYEEFDFCWRAKEAGYRIVINPKAKMWHFGSGTISSHIIRFQYYGYMARIRFAMKNFRGMRRVTFILVNILAVPFFIMRAAGKMLFRKFHSEKNSS
jgi:GT2 family glycosyltransferase